MPHIMQRPSISEVMRALRLIGRVVGASEATYCFEGRFAVRLAPGSGWWLVISPDDAGRFRVSVARSGRVRASMWCLAGNDARLAELASAALRESATLVA